MSSSPIANISRKVYETAVTERSRKARVLKMVESMTLHEQCEEMSINTFTENVEFDHQFITDLDIIIIELLHWGGVAFRDLGFFNGMGDDGYRQVNGTLMPNGSNISQIKIGYLFDPEDDPVSYLLIYLASATLVIFTFACLTHFYCVVSQFSAKKRTDILRVQKVRRDIWGIHVNYGQLRLAIQYCRDTGNDRDPLIQY
ncbi:hypothetical protein Fcan01_11318 [Folsomia candida]|uniref:Uncharacterized protein n=1 Tax=Folsomia candida TaxID=158441 RepID=A0A226ECJ5_FOLCA|nr:hypothetical protein Fcan01_11318 [Folsomia candida]